MRARGPATGAVAFEGEDIFGRPEDALVALTDRREVRAASGLVFAARASDGDVQFAIPALTETSKRGFRSSWEEALVMARPKKYPDELIARGVRLALESGRPIAQVAVDLGMGAETLRRAVRQAQADNGDRPDLPTTAEREEIRKLREENFELRRANEILKAASVFFAKELDPPRSK